MEQASLCTIIRDQTERALWETGTVIDCIPVSCWDKQYYNVPVWKHVYHMLHSLDQWLINPRDYAEPIIHEADLNNLDVPSAVSLTQNDIGGYFSAIRRKVTDYVAALRDDALLEYPEGCEYTKFTLILAQFRHLHTHMGMLMGFIVNDTGKWPKVLGLTGVMPTGEFDSFE